MSLGSVHMEHGEMSGISLVIREGPSLGGKDTKKLEAKLENIELCPGLLLCFQVGMRVAGGTHRDYAQSCLDLCSCRRHTLLVGMTYLF